MDDFDLLNAPQAPSGNGVGDEEDPAAAFLAQQESEIAGIENDEGFNILDSGEVPSSLGSNLTGDLNQDIHDSIDGAVNGDLHEECNGPSDTYAAISQVDRLQSEPESLRKWREEQLERLELLDANSRKQEVEWKEKAKVDLEEWYCRQDEQLEKTKVNNRAAEEALVTDIDDNNPGTEWEHVARLCDFNPKSSKQAKDVSRMRSILISLKTSPLVH
ncbi:Clathrin light chain A [Acipenser ruthenus]|uniref:Clathrin light chain n=1 Tax=Acipenser ruthenus TaxID=7906 RepID=A0A662YQW7_ACIRT|nr:clathrin light chain A-like isoform X3 [Acipenser ruthenus]RXM98241.1 Clathrin light chain A [Acipenser ruthenus]